MKKNNSHHNSHCLLVNQEAHARLTLLWGLLYPSTIKEKQAAVRIICSAILSGTHLYTLRSHSSFIRANGRNQIALSKFRLAKLQWI